jgi:hypothetical protein
MSSEERRELVKYLSALLAIPAVFGVAVPYVDVYVPENWVWLAVLVVAAIVAAGIRGIHALVYPAQRAAHPYLIVLGSLVASALVVASPEAIRLAVVNYSINPLWIFSSVGGLVLAAVYLFLAFKSARLRVSPLTIRSSGRVRDKVPISYVGARAAQLNR